MTSIRSLGILALTFFITAVPHIVYYFIRMRGARNNFPHGLTRYASVFFFISFIPLFLLAFFQASGMAAALAYLSEFLNVKFILAELVINGCFLIFHVNLKKRTGLRYEFDTAPKYLIVPLWVFLFLVSSAVEFTRMYGIIPIEQLIFHLALPGTGANFGMVIELAVKSSIDSVLLLVFLFIILSTKISLRGRTIQIPFNKFKKRFAAAVLPAAGLVCVVFITELPQYVFSSFAEPSTFYEDHYIPPEEAGIVFPEKKRNLIVIMAESFETGFFTREDGGAFTEELMPEIALLAKSNINFSGNSGIGGPVQLYGTEWTIAGIAAYYSGIPLAVQFLNQSRWNGYGKLGSDFLPGAFGLGDILHQAGYKNYFLLGSDIRFGGRDKYFKTHKDTVIFDYNYFRDNHFIPPEYYVWWGIEDRKLYRFAKELLADITAEEPFFITILTADTHPVGGYLDPEAEIIFDDPYKNALRDASRQMSEFVDWLQAQPFYENTTIVILGDHLYQDSSFFPEDFRIQKLNSRYSKRYFAGKAETGYNRYPLNIFINSPLDPGNAKNRSFSHFDMLPVLLESAGGRFDSEGLALGRPINKADTVTLVEYYGEAAMNGKLQGKSALYNAFWGAKNP